MSANALTLLRHLRRLASPTPRDPDADEVLLDRFVRDRDEAAFAALVRRHGPLVLRVCRRVLADTHAADDAFQATFCVLARKAPSLGPPRALASWLHGVAYRVAVKARAAETRRRRREAPAPCLDAPDPRPDPLAEVSVRELLAAVDEEVRRLPEVYRLPVILCCLEGRTREEAAGLLGWTQGSVKGRLERGRARLHARLARRGLGLTAALAAVEVVRGSASSAVPAALLEAAGRAALAWAAGPGRSGAGVSDRVAALAEGGLGSTAAVRLRFGAALVLAAIAAAGVGVVAHQVLAGKRPEPEREAEPVARAAGGAEGATQPPEGRTDRYGDPLPAGAVARLGTVRYRYRHHWDSREEILPDGKTALTNTDDEVLWTDLATGRLTDSWRLPKGYRVCGFSPDGRLALLADGEALRLWDLTLRKELRVFRATGQVGPEVYARFAPDGKVVATNSGVNHNPGLVRVWDTATGLELWQEGVMGFFDQGLFPLGFLPDGETLVVIDKSNLRVGLRDRATGRERRSFATMPRNDSRMHGLSPDGKTLFVGTAGSAVRAWDVVIGKELPPLGGHKGQAHSFAVSRDGKTVLTGGEDRLVLVWDWPAGKRRTRIDLGAGRSAGSMMLSADGKRAEIVVWGESAPRFFDLTTGEELPGPAEAHRAPVYGLAVAPDGKAVSAGTDDTVRVWDLRSGRQLHEYRTGHPVGASTLALSADGRLVATADFNAGKVLLQDRDTGRLVRTIDTGGASVRGVAFVPEGRLLAVSGDRAAPGRGASLPFLALWDAETGREVRRLEASSGTPRFSPDGRLLAALRGDEVRLWEATTGKPSFSLTLPFRGVAVAFSPDGRTLACGGRVQADGRAAGPIGLWEVATGNKRFGMDELPDWCECLAFSPDGNVLAAGGWEHKVRLWDLATGTRLREFEGHLGNVNALAFSPDGKTLVSVSTDTTGLVWDVADLSTSAGSRGRLEPKQLDSLWADLAGADAVRAYRAIGRLAAAPAEAVRLFKQRLAPAGTMDPRRVGRLVADLDSEQFAVRQAALRELERLRDAVRPALRQALADSPSAEVRKRLEELLSGPEQLLHSGDVLRGVRAVEVLERIGTREARQVLERLATGAPEARLTQEAKASLARLAARPADTP